MKLSISPSFFTWRTLSASFFSVFSSTTKLRQHRTIRQEPVAWDFSSAESLENRGILGVFPVFQTARMGEKTRHPAADDLCGVALNIL